MSDDYTDIPGLSDFDLGAVNFGPTPADIVEILDTLGIDTIGGVVFAPSDLEVEQLRGVRFASFEDAVLYLDDGSIIEFSSVVFLADEGLFGIIVDKDTM